MPQVVQDDLNDQLHKFMSSLENPNAIGYSSHLRMDSNESQVTDGLSKYSLFSK
ncbi:hypothetical protein SO802_008579 [Lithocarpus litseifolius]|uniref:Uncharacterized protein n=1 Tax=Lithocarpus litseifolius TaxID=425828 RepID=A0AAW2D9M7_9ROSI